MRAGEPSFAGGGDRSFRARRWPIDDPKKFGEAPIVEGVFVSKQGILERRAYRLPFGTKSARTLKLLKTLNAAALSPCELRT